MGTLLPSGSSMVSAVIIGGYEIFVSRLHIDDHPDQPEWLDHVDAGVLKIKLGMALVSISSIHLLRSFIDAVSSWTTYFSSHLFFNARL